MKKAQVFLRRHSSTILTVMGAAGVVATTVLAVKATPKALELIEEEKNEQNRELLARSIANSNEGIIEYEPVEKLKPLEVVKVAWKPYIPAAITGVSTIACIFGANYLSLRSQASLMSAYALLDSTFKDYRAKTEELYPEGSHIVEREVIKSKFDKDMYVDSEKELFFDFHSMRYFNATMEEVENAANMLNQKLAMDGFACLNDFYEILGIKNTPYGYQLGWSLMYNDRMYGKPELEFNYDKIRLEDGLECTTIEIDYPPSIEYTC